MASEQRIPEHIRQEAARWITEADAGLLSPQDEHALAIWLAADPLHSTAYARLERAWDAMGSISGTNEMPSRATVLPFRQPAQLRQPIQLERRRYWIGGAIAASLLLVALGGVNDWPTRLRADAMTATGERRAVTMADGSVVQLNTGSAITIAYRADRRVIHLLKGEASFSVAADPSRPFTVEAGGGTTTALGTRFIVRRTGTDTDVAVTEHRVRVVSSSSAARPEQSALVGEGQAVRYGTTGLIAPHDIDIGTAEAWTRGRLVFVDRPLVDVVAELNRYYPGYIRVVGSDLARRRFSGAFPVDDPLGAVDAIQRSLGIASTRLTNRLIFLHG